MPDINPFRVNDVFTYNNDATNSSRLYYNKVAHRITNIRNKYVSGRCIWSEIHVYNTDSEWKHCHWQTAWQLIYRPKKFYKKKPYQKGNRFKCL